MQDALDSTVQCSLHDMLKRIRLDLLVWVCMCVCADRARGGRMCEHGGYYSAHSPCRALGVMEAGRVRETSRAQGPPRFGCSTSGCSSPTTTAPCWAGTVPVIALLAACRCPSIPAFQQASTAWHRPLLDCAALHCTVLYCTVLHCTLLWMDG